MAEDTIDYKAEVLKVHPDAECFEQYYPTYDGYFYSVSVGLSSISQNECTEDDAWENAYNNLKQQGKL